MAVFAALLLAAARFASADSIKIGEQVYEGVYVSEGSASYYVSVPADGTVMNVAKSDVDPKSVKLTEDREARKAIYNSWVDKRKELRGDNAGDEPLANTDIVVDSSKKSSDDEKPKMKTVSAVGKKSGTADENAAMSEYFAQQRAYREAQLDSRRRHRESEKVRQLTQRRVITSEDAKGSGMGGGMSGGMNNGFGGGMNRR
jgi:hypothetical protein